MVKSYCVKQKKQTECVPGSEQYAKTKNGRTMMKCKCAECGITKTKFVNSNTTGGALKKAKTNSYCGANRVPKGKYRGSDAECIRKGEIRYHGINPIDITNLKDPDVLKKYEKLNKARMRQLEKKMKQGN